MKKEKFYMIAAMVFATFMEGLVIWPLNYFHGLGEWLLLAPLKETLPICLFISLVWYIVTNLLYEEFIEANAFEL